MPSIPDTYGRKKVANLQRSTKGYDTSSYEQGNRIQAQGIAKLAGTIKGVGEDRAREDIKKFDTDALIHAQDRENWARQKSLDLKFGNDEKEGFFARKGNTAIGIENEYNTAWKGIQDEALKDVTNPDARARLENSLKSMNTSNLSGIKSHRSTERSNYYKDVIDNRHNMAMDNVGFNWNNEDIFNETLQGIKEDASVLAKSQGVPVDTVIQKKTMDLYATRINGAISSGKPEDILYGLDLFNKGRANGDINDFERAMKLEDGLKPLVGGAIAEIAYKQSSIDAGVKGYDKIVDFVVDDLEGGDKIVNEVDGAIAKFGINSKWNPDVDVANLDRKGAISVYKDVYWKKNKIDELPENMQLLAFDSVVNHTSVFSRGLLKDIKNGATVNDVFNKRVKEYQRLAKSPKYAGNYDGWINRLKKLSKKYSATEPSNEDVYATVDRLNSQFAGAGDSYLKLHQETMKRKVASEKLDIKQVQDEISKNNSENNGDYTKLSPALKMKATNLGIDITAFTGVADQDTLNEINAMTTQQKFTADFDDPRYVQNIPFKELEVFRQEQQDLNNTDNKFISEQVDNVVDYYFSSLEKDTSNKLVKSKVAKMKKHLMYNLNKMYETQGKIDAKDVNNVASQYIKGSKTSTFFGDNIPFYDGEREIDLKDVEQSGYLEVIEEGLELKNLPRSEEAIINSYIDMKRSGVIMTDEDEDAYNKRVDAHNAELDKTTVFPLPQDGRYISAKEVEHRSKYKERIGDIDHNPPATGGGFRMPSKFSINPLPSGRSIKDGARTGIDILGDVF